MDWAADLAMAVDPDKDQASDELVRKMVNFILNGISPIDDAPDLPAGYWDNLQITAERRIALAGYRIADLILEAAGGTANGRGVHRLKLAFNRSIRNRIRTVDRTRGRLH